jgi:hypothetical protein
MATLKIPLNHLDSIMETMSKKVYTVLFETVHNLWVQIDGGKEEPFELPKRLVNMAYVKVDPKVVRVLYGEENSNSSDAPVSEQGPSKG